MSWNPQNALYSAGRAVSRLLNPEEIFRGVLNADQSALRVEPAVVATDSGYGNFRTTALTATAQAIKASAGNVYAMTLINPNTDAVYVKLFNVAAASVVLGTTVPVMVMPVPAGDGDTPGVSTLSGDFSRRFFDTAISIAAVTTLADNGSSAPAAAIYAEVIYG